MRAGDPDGSPVRGRRREESGGGFFQKLSDLFLGSSDPQREKRRLLKASARALRKINPHYYNAKTEKTEPALARVLFEFYQTLGPAQGLLSHASTSKVLKSIVIEKSLDKDRLELRDRLSEESIRKRVEQGDPEQVHDQISQDIRALVSYFDAGRAQETSETYACLHSLLRLIQFDYYFLLRKFDPILREGAFNAIPHFDPVNSEHIGEELEHFVEILNGFDPTANWSALWDIIRVYRGSEPVSPEAWKKLQQLIRRLKRTRELELLVQLVLRDPLYKPAFKQFKGNIVEEFLAKLKTDCEATFQKSVKEGKQKNVESICTQLFGSSSIAVLNNYSQEVHEQLSKKGLGGFGYILPMNALKAFLPEFLRKDMRQILDLLVISGKWVDNTPSRIMSESYHQMQAILEETGKFDESLHPDSEMGRRLQSIAARAGRNPQAQDLGRRLLKKVNEEARGLLVRAGQNSIALGKALKQVLDDGQKSSPELLINWRELANRAGRDIRPLISGTYKKLYLFVQLLRLFA